MNEEEKKQKLNDFKDTLSKLRLQFDGLCLLNLAGFERNLLLDIRPHISHIENDINMLLNGLPPQEIKETLHRGIRR